MDNHFFRVSLLLYTIHVIRDNEPKEDENAARKERTNLYVAFESVNWSRPIHLTFTSLSSANRSVILGSNPTFMAFPSASTTFTSTTVSREVSEIKKTFHFVKQI